MGANEHPDPRSATDVDDGATSNRRTRDPSPEDSRRLGGDTDKDPDLTGKSSDPAVNTLRMRMRREAEDQGIAADDAAPSRLDAARGPGSQPHPPGE